MAFNISKCEKSSPKRRKKPRAYLLPNKKYVYTKLFQSPIQLCHYNVNVNGGSKLGGSRVVMSVARKPFSLHPQSTHTPTQYRSVLIQTGPGGATGFYAPIFNPSGVHVLPPSHPHHSHYHILLNTKPELYLCRLVYSRLQCHFALLFLSHAPIPSRITTITICTPGISRRFAFLELILQPYHPKGGHIFTGLE